MLNTGRGAYETIDAGGATGSVGANGNDTVVRRGADVTIATHASSHAVDANSHNGAVVLL
jgi:hypothetical protein